MGQKDMGSRKPEYDMIPLRRIGQPGERRRSRCVPGLRQSQLHHQHHSTGRWRSFERHEQRQLQMT